MSSVIWAQLAPPAATESRIRSSSAACLGLRSNRMRHRIASADSRPGRKSPACCHPRSRGSAGPQTFWIRAPAGVFQVSSVFLVRSGFGAIRSYKLKRNTIIGLGSFCRLRRKAATRRATFAHVARPRPPRGRVATGTMGVATKPKSPMVLQATRGSESPVGIRRAANHCP
jgi:hypothetical protein